MGNVPQSHPLPSVREVAIAPGLLDGGLTANAGFLHFQTSMTVKITESKLFNRIEIIPMTETDRKLFFLSLSVDPEAKIIERMEELNKIIDALPDDGEAARLCKSVKALNLKGAFKELLVTIKKTMPEKWQELKKELIEIGINPDELI